MAARKRKVDEEEADSRDDLLGIGLMDFIPKVSSKFQSPLHLYDLTSAIEGCVNGSVKNGRYIITVPMRHGKSYTCLHSIAWALKQNPHYEIMYISYGASFAQRSSRKARTYAIEAGVKLSPDHNTIGEWVTTDGGSVLATGINGEIAGRGADLIFIDDPIKSRIVAESPDERQKAVDFVQEAISRLNPNGHVFVVSARWHVDDPSGQLLRTGEYTHIHKRAIEDEGLETERALWPEMRSLEGLKRTRHEVKDYNWYSWYQGEPRPPESALFRASPMVRVADPTTYQIAIGLDLGFTDRGDASAAVVLARGTDGVSHILRVEKWHKNAPSVANGIKALLQSYPNAPLFHYYSGPEKGTLDLLREPPYGIDIVGVPARYNKYARAMACADAWNSGRISVPSMAAWDTKAFCSEVIQFTGGEGEQDDCVDAMVAAYDALDGGGYSSMVPGFYGNRSM